MNTDESKPKLNQKNAVDTALLEQKMVEIEEEIAGDDYWNTQLDLEPEERERRKQAEIQGIRKWKQEIEKFMIDEDAPVEDRAFAKLQLSFENPGEELELDPFEAEVLGADCSNQGIHYDDVIASGVNQINDELITQGMTGNTVQFEQEPSIYRQLADKIIHQMKTHQAPWQRPWDKDGFLPFNGLTRKRYQGINILHLMAQQHYETCWMTEIQAESLGAGINENQKGTQIQYFKYGDEVVPRDAEGDLLLDSNGVPMREKWINEYVSPFLLHATVYNTEQMIFLPTPLPQPLPRSISSDDPLVRTETLLKSCKVRIEHIPNQRPFYDATNDSIYLNPPEEFASKQDYLIAALHELAHWTGHSSRLKRDINHPLGSEGYAKQTLRTAIAAMLLGDEIGIGHNPKQNEGYVFLWIRLLEADPRELWYAARDAEAIFQYLMNIEFKAWEAPLLAEYDPYTDEDWNDKPVGQTNLVFSTEHSSAAFDPDATPGERAFAKMQLAYENPGMGLELTEEEAEILGIDLDDHGA